MITSLGVATLGLLNRGRRQAEHVATLGLLRAAPAAGRKAAGSTFVTPGAMPARFINRTRDNNNVAVVLALGVF